MKHRISALFFLSLVASVSALEWPVGLEQIARRSALIVVGRVVDQYCAWDDEGREIYTYTTLEIKDSVVNQDGLGHVQMRHLGGRVGDVESHVHGLPRFALDQQVVVFLGPYPDSEYFGLIDWVRGVYRIENEGSIETVHGADIEIQPLTFFMKTIADYLQ